MNKTILKTISLSLLVSMFLTGANAEDINLSVLDMAGKQRMLSQRIAKDYIYFGQDVATSKAKKQLEESIKQFVLVQKELSISINDDEIKNLLMFVDMSIDEFNSIKEEAYSIDNAQLALDLSESMLEGSQYVVKSLEETLKIKKEASLVNIAGKQRMLSQRIAKYYIAYQAGIKDKNTVDQMKAVVKEFSEAQDKLLANQTNTPEINKKLNDVNRLWKIVYKFYLNIEKGGLPFIVFNSTDNITKKMNNITSMYVELEK